MSLEEGKLLSSDINDLIDRIDAEINKRKRGDYLQLDPSYYYHNTWEHNNWGTSNQIQNPNINTSWKCLKAGLRRPKPAGEGAWDGTAVANYHYYSVDNNNNNNSLQIDQIYNESTQFRQMHIYRNNQIYEDTTAEELWNWGVLEPIFSIDIESISPGTNVTAEDINILIGILNTINTDTYWNTSTAVTAGNLIQTIIEISNTLTKLENDTVDMKSDGQIYRDKRDNIGNPLGNTSGCNSACRGLCQSCLGSAVGSGSGGGEGCDYSGGGGGCDSCSSGCQGGCGGCGYDCSSSSD